MRDIGSGRDEEINTGDLLKTGVTCAADGAVLFAGALESETAATQIYLGRAGSAPQALTQGDGFKMPSKIDAAGRTLLFLLPRSRSVPPAAAGGGRGAGGAAPAAAATIRPRPRTPAGRRRGPWRWRWRWTRRRRGDVLRGRDARRQAGDRQRPGAGVVA